MNVVGTQNAHNLISISTDGKMCSWSLDMLSQPQVTKFLFSSTALLKTEQNRWTFPSVATLLYLITEYSHVNCSRRFESESYGNCLGRSLSVESGLRDALKGSGLEMHLDLASSLLNSLKTRHFLGLNGCSHVLYT